MTAPRWQKNLRCPAKLNLGLWVLGKRPDGFHALESLVVQTEWGDDLTLSWHDEPGEDRLTCDVAELPTGPDNLILKAAAAFRQACPVAGHTRFSLVKRIPWGGGLGGGSADAAGALILLNEAHGSPLAPPTLASLAARLGSDVPLFLRPEPQWMRGRGEVLEPALDLAEKVQGLSVVIAHPGFPVETPWAYKMLAAAKAYSAPDIAAKGREIGPDYPTLAQLHNDFRRIVDPKYPTIPLLIEALNQLPGVKAQMSGSGSACYALLAPTTNTLSVMKEIRHTWGENASVVCTVLR